MHETGHPKLVHWDNPEGWDGEGLGSGRWGGMGRRGEGNSCTPVIDSCQCMAKPQYCKVISLQLKERKKETVDSKKNEDIYVNVP